MSSGFKISLNFLLLSNLRIIFIEISGDCSINLSISFLQICIKSIPLYVLSLGGKDNSVEILRENFPYDILALLCASFNSLTLKNCPIVVKIPDIKFKAPINNGK